MKFKEKKAPDEGIRIGTRIIRQLSTAFYPNLLRVFEELVANARDAMATVVKVHIDEDRIVFMKNVPRGTKKNAGVYVKVMGRIVNYDNPDAIIDFKDMTHGLQFERNIQAEINADCLNDILLTNRSGFMEDNVKYETFRSWVWNKLRDYVENEYQKYQKENIDIEHLSHLCFMKVSITCFHQLKLVLASLFYESMP